MTNGNTGQFDKLSSSLEDYLEAIFNLANDAQGARSKDIADVLKVSRASVTGALQELKKRGLVNYEPYGNVTLTAAGMRAGEEVVRRHNIIKSFFVNVLGVEAGRAQISACKAEHVLGSEVISRLLMFIEFVSESEAHGRNIAGEFGKFCEERRFLNGQVNGRG